MTTLTWLGEKIASEPQTFGEAIRLWLLVGMGFGIFAMDDAQQSMFLAAISVTITFFTRRAATPNAKVEARIQEEVATRSGSTGTGRG